MIRRVAVRPDKRVAGARLRATHNSEWEAEQRAHLTFPVADQPGRRNHENAFDEPARKDLSGIEAGHDRLAGAGIVGEKEPQRRQAKHVLVDRDPLVRQRIDQRNLRREGRIEEVAVSEAGCLGHCRDHVWRAAKSSDDGNSAGAVAGSALSTDAAISDSSSKICCHARCVGFD